MTTPNYYSNSTQIRVLHADKQTIDHIARYLSLQRGRNVTHSDVISEMLASHFEVFPALEREISKIRQAVQS